MNIKRLAPAVVRKTGNKSMQVESKRHLVGVAKVKSGIGVQHTRISPTKGPMTPGQGGGPIHLLAHHGGVKSAPIRRNKTIGGSDLSINHTHAAVAGVGGAGAAGYGLHSRSQNKHPSSRGYNHPIYKPYGGGY